MCNQDKFQAMSLGSRYKKKGMNLNIKDINIKSSPGIDLLGVAIDDELNFTKHINNVCTKGSRKVGVLMRFRNLIPTEAKLRLQSFYFTSGYILSYSMAPLSLVRQEKA